jgi:SAM-dependent methyltransferase
MQYDPIKDRLASIIQVFPALRRMFYMALDFLLLRQRYVKAEIRKYFKDGMRFYDAGAGFCQYSDFVLNSYPKSTVLATDLKTDYLFAYQQVADSRFFYKTADLQVFCPKQQYDMAIAIDILEHIEHDLKALQNFHAALSEGGILIISTPSDQDEAARFTEEHVRPGYSKDELEAKLTSVGFEIISSRYSYGLWGALSWKLMMKYPLALLNKNLAWGMILPFWYLTLFPISELLMYLDMNSYNLYGTGILIVARKAKSSDTITANTRV